jgi:hypothetical protein
MACSGTTLLSISRKNLGTSNRKSIVLGVPNYSQQDATFIDLLIFTYALHVSGGSSAHHQEHITCYVLLMMGAETA